jgi:hypothetical protein
MRLPMPIFKVRLLRSVSHETEIEVEAISEEKAREEAMRQSPFLIWEHRNKAEYEVLFVKPISDDVEETK